MRRSDGAFTLLEVMAAVAVVAIVFTTLARVASQGLQSEGTSRRRFEASLLADSVLADVEDQVAAGIPPELGSSEEERGLFTVLVDVTRFDLLSVIAPSGTGADAPAGADAPSLLAGTGLAGQPATPLRQIAIRIRWNEGLNEQTVSRTTFGLDQAAIQSVLGAAVERLEASGGLSGAGGPGGIATSAGRALP